MLQAEAQQRTIEEQADHAHGLQVRLLAAALCCLPCHMKDVMI